MTKEKCNYLTSLFLIFNVITFIVTVLIGIIHICCNNIITTLWYSVLCIDTINAYMLSIFLFISVKKKI